MVSRKLAFTGTAAACVACCAPLVVPLIWPVLVAAGVVGAGGAATGWLAGLSLEIFLCGSIALAALAGGAIWLRQHRRRHQAQVPNLADGEQCDLGTCGPANPSGANA